MDTKIINVNVHSKQYMVSIIFNPVTVAAKSINIVSLEFYKRILKVIRAYRNLV